MSEQHDNPENADTEQFSNAEQDDTVEQDRNPDQQDSDQQDRPGPPGSTPVRASAGNSAQGRLELLARQVLEPLGFELLDVQVQNPGRHPTVVIRIDRLDEQPVTLENIEAASRAIGSAYDRADPIAGEYRLELESPGPKRPLIRPRHFERMLGLKVRVRGNGHNFTAPLTALDGDQATFETTDGPVTLSTGSIQANLAEFPPEHR